MEEQTKGYPSDLSDEQWEVLESLVGVKEGSRTPTQVRLTSDRECYLVCDTHRLSMACLTARFSEVEHNLLSLS